MDNNAPSKDVATKPAAGRRQVTRAKAQTRARELAEIAGRVPTGVKQEDYERAKRELTGESDSDRQDAILDSIPEKERWDPVPGSAGRQAPESPSEDEDAEGKNESAQLVEDGIGEAEREQALGADDAVRRDDGTRH